MRSPCNFYSRRTSDNHIKHLSQQIKEIYGTCSDTNNDGQVAVVRCCGQNKKLTYIIDTKVVSLNV